MAQPSPDWDLVTFKWAASKLNGEPESGSIQVDYNGGVMLDDDPSPTGTPLLIFPTGMSFPITTTKILVGGTLKDVGYVEFSVPATNDPDIIGAGGTYKITEVLSGGRRRTYDVIADINTPNGWAWLNKLAPSDPTTGAPLSVVYYSDFTALAERVSDIELNGGGTGGGGVTSYEDLTDKPFIPSQAADINAQPAGNYVSEGDGRLSNARPPTAHNQAASTISDSTPVGRSVLTAADAAAARSAIGAGTSNLALGSNPSQAKAGNWLPVISDVSGLRQELDDLASSGYISGIINEGDTPPAPGIYIVRPV